MLALLVWAFCLRVWAFCLRVCAFCLRVCAFCLRVWAFCLRVWAFCLRVWAFCLRVCAVCVQRVRVRACVGFCRCVCVLEPHNSAFSFVCFARLAAAAVSYLYHTVPQALKLSTLWQRRRYNSSRSSCSSFCDGHGRRICVRVCVPCSLFERPQNLQRGARILHREQGDTNPHLRTSCGISRATAQPQQLQQQQRYNSSTTALQPLALVTATDRRGFVLKISTSIHQRSVKPSPARRPTD